MSNSTNGELFNKFKDIQMQLNRLTGIVQNDGFRPTEEHLQTFTEQADDTIDKLQTIKTQVIEHFTNDDDLLGEWSDKVNAFWFGANGREWIAYKGSRQVFVYPCDHYPAPPSQVIQHNEPVETLNVFTDAIRTGTVYNATYMSTNA